MAVMDSVSCLSRIATALETIAANMQAEIPTPTAEDVGKVLAVDEEGNYVLTSLPAADDVDGADDAEG